MYNHPGCRLYLVRHRETANSEQNCFNSHFNMELFHKGIEPMCQVAKVLALKLLNAIYSSYLRLPKKGA